MAIDREGTEFLLFAHQVGVDFASTLMIGRQSWKPEQDEVRRVATPFGHDLTESVVAARDAVTDGFAEPLFDSLGASSVDSLDVAEFEGATVLHDMNEPIPERLAGQYSCVLDGGALEHIFNFPTAIENCMRLVAPGGHLLMITPANNQVGHGFYQFSPELVFRVLNRANGFTVEHLLMNETGLRPRWLRVADPAEVGRRATVSTVGEASLYVVARRTGEAGIKERPQQSDYAVMWATGTSGATNGSLSDPQRRRKKIRKLVGATVGDRLRDVRVALGTASGATGTEKVHLAELARRSGPTTSVRGSESHQPPAARG
jgi:hypothetical protein